MAIRKTYAELRRAIAEDGSDVVLGIGEVARKFYCKVYNDAPSWVLRDNVLVSPIPRAVLSDMCGGEQTPEIPSVPEFTGGQCCDATYKVTARVLGYQCSGSRLRTDSIGSVTVTGKIVKAHFGAIPPELRFSGGYLEYKTCSGKTLYKPFFSSTREMADGGCSSTASGSIDADKFDPNKSRCLIYSVELVSGSDDCGNPPGFFPELPPPVAEDVTTDIDVDLSTGDSVTYNVSINLDRGGYVSFPPVVNVSGVSVSFDAGGVTIGGDTVNNYSGGGGSGGDNVNSDNADGEGDLEEEAAEEEDGGMEETVEELVGVKIEMTSIPSNAKVWYGEGSPDVRWAGWIEFVKDGFYYNRSPIEFTKNIYDAPEGCTGYAVTFKNGYKGTVTKIVKEKKVVNPIEV